jgi:hypothetical protein
MAMKNFIVRTGIKTGDITLDAATGNANVTNVNATDAIIAANLIVNSYLKSNLVPNSNGVLSMATASNRFKDFYLKGNIDINGQILSANDHGVIVSTAFVTDLTLSNSLFINSYTDSTAVNLGSFVTRGGVGIAKDLTVGGNVNLATATDVTPKVAINYNDQADCIDFKFT